MNKLLVSSMLFVSLMCTINFSFFRFDIFIQFLETSALIISLELVFVNLCSINQRESALSLFFPEESWFAHFLGCDADFLWRLRLTSQTVPQQVVLFYDRQTTTDWTTNLRQESGKLVYGSLHLLAPEWTVVKKALCRWCSHRSPSHADFRACCRWRTPGWIFRWSLRCGGCRWSWARKLWEDCSRSATVPNSSFAEVRMGLLIEPTHMEDEDRTREWKGR